MDRRDFLAGGVLAATALSSGRARAQTRARSSPPNIVVIVVDDMRFDEYGGGGHPYLRTPHIDALGTLGATFSNAYHTTPLCSPNRACIVTGQYASRHEIIDNSSRSYASHRLQTFAQELQRAGYETAHVGKWHMGNDPTPRPGYDYWVSFPGQGTTVNPELYEDGRLHRVDGYITDLLTDRAVSFLTRARSRPFMLYIGHKAVHPELQQRDDGSVDPSTSEGFVPAERHRGKYAGKRFPRRPSYGPAERGRSGKPVVAGALDLKRSPAMVKAFGAELLDDMVSDETIQQRAEMMLAVDESVGRVREALERQGALENTMIVFMSDNGSFFGEHGLSVERRLPYEESVKGPLLVCHPAAIERGRRIKQLALSIDIAPTLVEAAGQTAPARMQGRSLMPLLQGSSPRWRESCLMEYYSQENPFPWLTNLDYRAVRLGRYKYIRWIRYEEAQELYDLESDPFEQRNLAYDAKYAATVAQARSAMASLVVESLGLRP